ncbi:MAG: RpiB/LacA/LacB family sugar-phosphate isomerase [Caulobacter sp.]|nr:RpiB/LacA/LacB family sugar-phosphate isomerase [Caulobacter sp.]
MRVAIASDHAAVALKAELAAWLAREGHEVIDLGPAGDATVDYPDYGYKLAEHVANVLALGARLVEPDMAKTCIAAFLIAAFLIAAFAGDRHSARVDKLGAPPFLSLQA